MNSGIRRGSPFQWGQLSVFPLVIVTILLGGCDFRTEKYVANDPNSTRVDVRQASFRNVYDKVIGPKCAGCHGSAGGVSLKTYEEIFARLGRVRERSIVLKDMPKAPTPALTRSELDLLDSWIRMGAPRDPVNPEPSPSPSPSPSPTPTSTPSPEPSWEPIPATFEGIKARIFTPKCTECHNPDDHTDLDTEQNLIDFGLVVPGDPSRSEVYRRSILPIDDPDHMPPDEMLSREELTAMHAWILHIKQLDRKHR